MSDDRIQQSHHHHHNHEPNEQSLHDDNRKDFNQKLSDLIESLMVEPSGTKNTHDEVAELDQKNIPPHHHPLNPKPFYLFEQHKKKQAHIESIKKTDPFGKAAERHELN